MSTIDPDQIPPTPVYTITLSASGTATVDGEEVTSSGGDANAARLAALAEVRIKAALHNRPVRAIAKEQDGSAWPLIVAVDGTVTTLDRPHPTPSPPPAPAPAAPPTVPPQHAPSSPTAAEATNPRELPNSEDWSAPPPAEYLDAWHALCTHVNAGTLTEAVIIADQIETDLARRYGPLHPLTVNMLTVRAWLTLRQSAQPGEWAEPTELLLDAAERRQEAKAQPEEETAHVIREAHGAWICLRAEDPETALELSERLLGLLDGDEPRARDVVQWAASGAARHGAA
ncbi:hypothetical protein [Streptomyces formicae]